MHQFTTPSLSQFLTLPIVQTLLPVTFGYSLRSEAVVMRQLSRWQRLWRRSLTFSHKRTSMGPSRSCWNGKISVLKPEEITSKCAYEKGQETYLMVLVHYFLTLLFIFVSLVLSTPLLFPFPRLSSILLSIIFSVFLLSFFLSSFLIFLSFSFSLFFSFFWFEVFLEEHMEHMNSI